jgi:hypothetical protein
VALPTCVQVEGVTDRAKKPVAALFPKPPEVRRSTNSFRTLKTKDFAAIPRRVSFFLRQGQAMRLNFAELNDGGNPAQGLITRDLKVAPNSLLHKNAAEVRTWRKYTRNLKLKQVTLELSREALETIASIMRSRGGIGKVREVHFNRGEVTDATYKFAPHCLLHCRPLHFQVQSPMLSTGLRRFDHVSVPTRDKWCCCHSILATLMGPAIR